MSNEPSSSAPAEPPIGQAKALFARATPAPVPSDHAAMERVVKDLETMHVEIDPDPTVCGGAPVLRAKIAQVETFLSSCLDMVSAARVRVQHARTRHRDLQLGLKLATDLLVAKDPDVRGGRNIADRAALASIKLQDEHLMVREADGDRTQAETILQIATSKLDHLKDLRRHLRGQLRDITDNGPAGTGAPAPARYTLPAPSGNLASRVDLDPEELVR